MTPDINLFGETEMPETTANLPEHKGTYGPVENADDTRQAQQQVANDTPTDVNFNAIVARSQSLTVDVLGKSFQSNQDIRDKVAAAYMAKLMGTAAS